jgi:hypothetical protein
MNRAQILLAATALCAAQLGLDRANFGVVAAQAEGLAVSSPPLAVGTLITASATISLPTGWHEVDGMMVAGGAGAGCGIVEATGTASAGGSAGGTSFDKPFYFTPSDFGNVGSIVVNIGTAGAGCTSSGTTAGSTGSAPANGSVTSIIVGSNTLLAYAGGAGANPSGAASNTQGGGSAGMRSSGNGSTAGQIGGENGGNGAVGISQSGGYPGSGVSGAGGVSGAAGSNGTAATQGPAGAPAGGGINAGNTAFAGGAAGTGEGNGNSAAGGTVCSNGTTAGVNGLTDVLAGIPGSAGGACTIGPGGNGAVGAGYGYGGAGGGSAQVGNTAGSGSAGGGGAVRLHVSELDARSLDEIIGLDGGRAIG